MCGFAQHLTMFTTDRSIQQTTANADLIRGVEERIQSLCGILAYPVDDQDREEKARREILRKFVFSLQEQRVGLSSHRFSQEVSWSHRKAQTTFRTKWNYKVPQ